MCETVSEFIPISLSEKGGVGGLFLHVKVHPDAPLTSSPTLTRLEQLPPAAWHALVCM